MPCVNFSDELVSAFPKAKVVLTQREPEAWVKSVESTIYYILTWRIWRLVTYIEPVCYYFSHCHNLSHILSLF